MKKRSYATPSIKVVAFQVEGGFLGSGDYKIGKVATDADPNPIQGVQDFERETASGWTFRN